MKGKSFSSTLRRKRIEAFTLKLLTLPLFTLKSLEGNVTSTSHPNTLEDVPARREGLNDWDNYLLTNDRLASGKYRVRLSQPLTPIKNRQRVKV